MNKKRLNKILQEMKLQNIPQMLISDPSTIFYLTGKWIHPSERMLALYINLKESNKLFINELFPVYEDLGVEKVWFNDTEDAIEIVANYIDKQVPMGIDKNWPSHFLLRLMDLKGGSSFVNGSNILDKIRACKDLDEINLMREASRLNDIWN